MKKTLVVALGNPLVPEDATALQVVQELSRRNNLPDDVEIIFGGTDLLRIADQLRGRELIILVDSCVDAQDEPLLIEHGAPELDNAQQHAHHLSAVQALDLIRLYDESVRNARCIWFLQPIPAPAGRGA